MLLNLAESQQHELQEVMAFHVIPQLHLCDAWALAQACSSLRSLIKAGLSGRTWTSLVHNSFPAGHPLRSVSAVRIQSQIRQLAALHASIRSGRAASVTRTCLFLGGYDDFDSTHVINHQRDASVCQRDLQLQLHGLDVQLEPPAMSPRILARLSLRLPWAW